MGSGLCRSTDGKPRAVGVDGFYRQIVFNYAKQWTHSNKRPKRDKTNMKHKKDKPTISGPFPADPDRLEGDKWRYVILTRLDTEPPPERPPRTKRRRRQQQQQQQQRQRWSGEDDDGPTADSVARGLWDSMRRRRRRRSCRLPSHGPARPSPPRPRRRRPQRPQPTTTVGPIATTVGPIATTMGLIVATVVDLTTIGPTATTVFRARLGRRLRLPPVTADRSPPPPPPHSKRKSRGKTGLFASVGRVTAMTDDLLSSR